MLRWQRQASGKFNYTSGAVDSEGKASWKGLTRACVSAKLPGGEGAPDPPGPPPPHGADWCASTPVGECRTGCPVLQHGPCGPDKKVPERGSCNKCM